METAKDTVQHDAVLPAGDDDTPTLSSHALEALKEFLAEQSRAVEEASSAAAEDDVALVSEDWRLSQFWYNRETAETVANEVLNLCRSIDSPAVACIACPTLYAYLKKIDPNAPAQILEYDKRFEQYGSEFTFYDYNLPEDLPSSMKHSYPIIVADPPYLSQECLEKVAKTISFLTRPGQAYLLLLTDIMLIKKLKLSNELASRLIDFQTPSKQKEEELFLKQNRVIILLKKREEKKRVVKMKKGYPVLKTTRLNMH